MTGPFMSPVSKQVHQLSMKPQWHSANCMQEKGSVSGSGLSSSMPSGHSFYHLYVNLQFVLAVFSDGMRAIPAQILDGKNKILADTGANILNLWVLTLLTCSELLTTVLYIVVHSCWMNFVVTLPQAFSSATYQKRTVFISAHIG